MAAESQLYREMVDGGARGIIGEPTALEVVHAHKGVFGFVATARGRAAHSSTDKGLNANLAMIPFLVEMKQIHDETERQLRVAQPRVRSRRRLSWNIGINDHTRAVNITAAADRSAPSTSDRCPGMDVRPLIDRARNAAEVNGLEFKLDDQRRPGLHRPPMRR